MAVSDGQDGRGGHLIALDLLRFGCAISVMGHHYFTGFYLSPAHFDGLPIPLAAPRSVAASLFAGGWVGVQIFFVISGFVIVNSVTGATCASFVRKRFVRLAPAVWLCATITASAIIVLRSSDGTWMAWVITCTLSPIGAHVDRVYWTLGVEIIFYAAVASALIRLDRSAGLRNILLAIGLFSTAFWFAIGVGIIDRNWADHQTLALTLLPHGCFFALGAMLSQEVAFTTGVRHQLIFTTLTLTCATQIYLYAAIISSGSSVLYPELLLLVALMVIKYAGVLQAMLVRAIAGRTAAILGLVSYPVYLLHHGLGGEIIYALCQRGWNYWSAAATAACVVLSLSLAIALHTEALLRKWLNVLLDRLVRSRAPSAIASAG